MSSELKRALLISFQEAWERRFFWRVESLTDAEYFWEPGPNCWSVRINSEGRWVPDREFPVPDPPPLTTIAWRMSHLGEDQLDAPPTAPEEVIDHHFVQGATRPREWVGSAAEAVALLKRNYKIKSEAWANLTDEQFGAALGPKAHMYQDSSYGDLCFHDLDECTHHLAEILLMRDLYRVFNTEGHAPS